MEKETKCLHSGYKPNNGESGAMPIYQSTTYKYDSSEHVGDLFDLKVDGHMYSRISNPTVAFVEEKITALEGGVGALCTSSGQMANLISVLNILGAGDHFVCTGSAYGGTMNLFGSTFKKFGIEVTFIDENLPLDQLQKEIKPNTKAVFGETITNPTISVLDIEKFAALAHNNSIPLIVDNTFATPILCNPFDWGADIITHSTTKYMEGHAVSLGGIIVDSGNFDWNNGKFPGLSTPDETYHGVTYTESFGKSAYIVKARVQLMRDFGAYPQAIAAFLLNLGLETLPLRIRQHSENARKVAEFLQIQPEIEAVNYPSLKSDKYYDLAQKYCPEGSSGVIAVVIKGGKANAVKFLDALKLATIEVHVADIHTCILHPASSTHRQLTDEQLESAGILPGMIRLSVGIENINDIIEDLKLGLEALKA